MIVSSRQLRKALALPPATILFYIQRLMVMRIRNFFFGTLQYHPHEWILRCCSWPSIHDVRENFEHFFLFSPASRQNAIKEISARYPQIATQLLHDADTILRHEFNFLGSGLYPLGPSLPWNRDWVNNIDWPNTFASSSDPVRHGETSDVKFPWELSRFYHAIALGQAYWLTSDEKYSRELINEIVDWDQQNPLYRSCNWSNAMEVSIRLANIIAGLGFIIGSPAYTEEVHRCVIRLLWRHGAFIMHNLEAGALKTNHYIADFVGIVYLSAVFPDLSRVQRWRGYCLREFEKEVIHQFHEDGSNFEASLSYHRLVTEITVWIALLCRRIHRPLHPQVLERIERACEYVAWYTKPNGLAPQVGDNDDGRLHLMDGMPVAEMRDHRHIGALAAILFPQNRLFHTYCTRSTAVVWMGESFRCPELHPEDIPSRLFPNAGVAIMRNKKDYCLVDAGENGQDGFGGHAHNDQLSFELCFDGEDLIVDPGTYAYTSRPVERNRFRSTAMHNTVRVDGQEINPIPQQNIFGLPDASHATIVDWKTSSEYDQFIARHSGYARFDDPVIHERRYHWNKISRVLSIEDILHSKGVHAYEWFFHCSTRVMIKRVDSRVVVLQAPHERMYRISIDIATGAVELDLYNDAISPSYGALQNAPVISWRCHSQHASVHARIRIEPIEVV